MVYRIFQTLALAYVLYQIGREIKLFIVWGPDAIFWAFWICLISTVALGAHVLHTSYKNMHLLNTAQTNQQGSLANGSTLQSDVRARHSQSDSQDENSAEGDQTSH